MKILLITCLATLSATLSFAGETISNDAILVPGLAENQTRQIFLIHVGEAK